MFGSVSTSHPWAVILCRFKGSPPEPTLEGPIEQFYRDIFTPGTGGLVEYWRDASLGAIDIMNSSVLGWVELEITRANAGLGSGVTRSTLVDDAIRAAQRNGLDPVTGFFSQIAIITQKWSRDDVPGGTGGAPDWTNPNDPRIPFWIDGSEDGRGKVTLTPPHDGDISAHEMGHSFGMQHDVASDLKTHYADPCCIMSQNAAFIHPRWMVNFGPAICLPHLIQRNWMYARRIYYDDGRWLAQPDGITLPLASIFDPGAHANLGIKLSYKDPAQSWDYYVEYVKPTDWNQGLQIPYVFIRRISSVIGIGETPIYLGAIKVPTTLGVQTDFVEPLGDVKFQVEQLDAEGRIMKVSAKKL